MQKANMGRNWGAKTGFFYAGTTALVTIWTYFRVPETGGFSFAELDILFTNKVPARKFTNVRIRDEVAGHETFDGQAPEGEDLEKCVGEEQHIEVSRLDEKRV